MLRAGFLLRSMIVSAFLGMALRMTGLRIRISVFRRLATKGDNGEHAARQAESYF